MSLPDSPQCGLWLPGACGDEAGPRGVVSPGTALLFSRAVLDELEHGVWSVIPLRPDSWQPVQLCCRIRGLGGSVYKCLLRS